MAPYYITVIFLNIFFSAMLYFAFGKKALSYRSIVSIAAISLLTGLLFPTLVGYLNIYIVLILGLLAVATGSYYLIKRDFDREENTGDAFVEFPAEQEDNQEPAREAELTKTETLPEEEEIIVKLPPVPEVSASVKKVSKKKQKKKKKQQLNQGLNVQETGSAPVSVTAEVQIAEISVVEIQEIQEPEIQEPEIQEPEIQEPEIQEPEIQEPEIQEPEIQIKPVKEEIPVSETSETPAPEPEVIEEEVHHAFVFDDNMEDSHVRIHTQPSGDSEELRESYIMRGFDAKGTGDYLLAVKYFESAIELNPPVDLAEMIQFDIYTMLRELGHYSKSKESLSLFIARYGSRLSAASSGELKSQIKYIEILQDMLNKANSPKLPYSRIPALIKISAEEKFNEWKSESLY